MRTLHQQRSIPWDDLEPGHDCTYKASKLLNILFTYELARRLVGTGVTANCLSPGFVRTNLGREATGAFRVFLRLAPALPIQPRSRRPDIGLSGDLATGGPGQRSLLREVHPGPVQRALPRSGRSPAAMAAQHPAQRTRRRAAHDGVTELGT
jgi:NAD(P)-dependent dehydrogenase (short-subunit alcohol dehydrogenase family)